jgi:hypothetical protein
MVLYMGNGFVYVTILADSQISLQSEDMILRLKLWQIRIHSYWTNVKYNSVYLLFVISALNESWSDIFGFDLSISVLTVDKKNAVVTDLGAWTTSIYTWHWARTSQFVHYDTSQVTSVRNLCVFPLFIQHQLKHNIFIIWKIDKMIWLTLWFNWPSLRHDI